jgi:hypothetical protein
MTESDLGLLPEPEVELDPDPTWPSAFVALRRRTVKTRGWFQPIPFDPLDVVLIGDDDMATAIRIHHRWRDDVVAKVLAAVLDGRPEEGLKGLRPHLTPAFVRSLTVGLDTALLGLPRARRSTA